MAAVGPEVSSAPLFAWLAPATEDDSEFGGRMADQAEAARWGDILAENSARDENGTRVVWQ